MPSHVDPAIFVHAQLGSKPVVFRAMEELRLRQAEAVGYLVMLWGGCALHQEDGCVAHCSDEQIEAWANWRGRRGRFAAFIRAHHVDESGVLNEWPDWAGKLSVQRAKDRERQRRKRAEQGPKPASVPDLSTDGPRDVTGTVHGQSTDRHASVTLQSIEEESIEFRSSSSTAREEFFADPRVSGFFRHLTDRERTGWEARIDVWLAGEGWPGEPCPSPNAIADGLTAAMTAKREGAMSERWVRGCIRQAGKPPRGGGGSPSNKQGSGPSPFLAGAMMVIDAAKEKAS
jgi:hypothetical protein